METANLIYLIFLIIPVLVFGAKYQLKLNKRTLYVIFRMVIQLSFIGIILQLLFDLNNGFVNIVYILFMMTVASYSMIKTTKLPIKRFGLPIWIAVVIPHIFVLLFFNSFVIDLNQILDARYLVPVGGMLLGNS